MDGRDNGTGGFWPARTVSPSDTQPRSSQRHGLLYVRRRARCLLDPMTIGLFPDRRSRQAGNHSGADEAA